MAAQPKLDLKMLVLPAVLLLSRRVNMKDSGGADEAANLEGARNILWAQQGLGLKRLMTAFKVKLAH